MKQANRWDQFWFSTSDPGDLAICRILFYSGLFFTSLIESFTSWSEAPPEFWQPVSFFNLFHIAAPSAWMILVLTVLWRLSLIFSAFGFYTRISQVVAAILSTYLYVFFYSHGFLHHPYQLFVVICLILMFAKSGEAFSVDAWRTKKTSQPSGEFTWPVKMVWVVWCLMFFAAGLAKLRNTGLSWATSENMQDILRHNIYYFSQGLGHRQVSDDWPNLFLQSPWLCQLSAIGVLSVELLSPLILFGRRPRLILVACIFTMQVGIWYVLFVDFRPQLVCYAFFLPWSRIVDCMKLGRKKYAN